MTLDGIPAYAIRSYFAMLGRVRHMDHPNLPTLVLKEMSKYKVMGSELLTLEVVTALGQKTIAELWKRVSMVETQVGPCPESEVQT